MKNLLQKKKTLLISVPPGRASRVQPLDVSVNNPVKNSVRIQFEKHFQENLTVYVEGKISASERRVLLTKWVGNAWDEVCSNKEDGSEDALVHIEGISEYVMPKEDKEFHLDTSTDEGDDSEEGDLEATDAEETD